MTFLEQCIEVNVSKGTVNILQGCVVTHNVLGGLTIYLQVANILSYIRAKKIMKVGWQYRQSYRYCKKGVVFVRHGVLI